VKANWQALPALLKPEMYCLERLTSIAYSLVTILYLLSIKYTGEGQLAGSAGPAGHARTVSVPAAQARGNPKT
jgi:hypothetical protein